MRLFLGQILKTRLFFPYYSNVFEELRKYIKIFKKKDQGFSFSTDIYKYKFINVHIGYVTFSSHLYKRIREENKETNEGTN